MQALVVAWGHAGAAPRTVRRRYGTMRAVLNRAVECDLIARTPCRGVKLPAVAPLDRPQVTAQNVTALAEAMGGYGLMVYLGAVLGLRLGHSDPRLTLAMYAQATTEADRAAADRLGDRFLGVMCDESAMPGTADAG